MINKYEISLINMASPALRELLIKKATQHFRRTHKAVAEFDHAAAVKDARAKLDTLLSVSQAQLADMFAADVEREKQEHLTRINGHTEKVNATRKLVKELMEWRAPSGEYEEVKTELLAELNDQLTQLSSIVIAPPNLAQNANVWFQRKLSQYGSDLAHHIQNSPNSDGITLEKWLAPL